MPCLPWGKSQRPSSDCAPCPRPPAQSCPLSHVKGLLPSASLALIQPFRVSRAPRTHSHLRGHRDSLPPPALLRSLFLITEVPARMSPLSKARPDHRTTVTLSHITLLYIPYHTNHHLKLCYLFRPFRSLTHHRAESFMSTGTFGTLTTENLMQSTRPGTQRALSKHLLNECIY